MVEELSSQGDAVAPQLQTSAPAPTKRLVPASGGPQACSRDPESPLAPGGVMPSDFLTPFLELGQDFCQVSVGGPRLLREAVGSSEHQEAASVS